MYVCKYLVNVAYFPTQIYISEVSGTQREAIHNKRPHDKGGALDRMRTKGEMEFQRMRTAAGHPQGSVISGL